MQAALARVRAQLGRDYGLIVAGERVETADKLVSTNPANPDEVIGIHCEGHAGTGRPGGGDGTRQLRQMEPHARRNPRSNPHAGQNRRTDARAQA